MVGENSKDNNLDVNATKEKKLTNIRAAGSDEALQLIPPKILSLEQAIEFIKEDELVEVTHPPCASEKRSSNQTEPKYRNQDKN